MLKPRSVPSGGVSLGTRRRVSGSGCVELAGVLVDVARQPWSDECRDREDDKKRYIAGHGYHHPCRLRTS
jgi:hypothetical protein